MLTLEKFTSLVKENLGIPDDYGLLLVEQYAIKSCFENGNSVGACALQFPYLMVKKGRK